MWGCADRHPSYLHRFAPSPLTLLPPPLDFNPSEKLFPLASTTVGRPFDSAPLTPVGSVHATLQFDLTVTDFYANEDKLTQGLADSYTAGDASRIVVQSVKAAAATARRRMANALDISFAVLPTEAAITSNGGPNGVADEDAIALQESVAAVEPTTVRENVNTQVGSDIVSTAVVPEGGAPSVVSEPVFGESLGASQLAEKESEDDDRVCVFSICISPSILMIGAAVLAGLLTLVVIVAIVAGAAIIIAVVVTKAKASAVATDVKPPVVQGVRIEMGETRRLSHTQPISRNVNPMANADCTTLG